MMIDQWDINEWIHANLNFQYKNKSRFFFYDNGVRTFILVTIDLPAAKTIGNNIKGEMMKVSGTIDIEKKYLGDYGTINTTALVKAVFKLMGLLVLHEYQETFTYQDVIVFDPHDTYKDAEDTKHLMNSICDRHCDVERMEWDHNYKRSG